MSDTGDDLGGPVGNRPARPVVASNWGIDTSPTRLAVSSNRKMTTALAAVVAVAVLSVPLFYLFSRSSSAPAVDDAWRTLDAYARAVAAGAPLEDELSPAERSRLTDATRVRTREGEMLALVGDGVCWAVPVAGSTAGPVEVDRALCP